ncbi:MAG: Phenylalanine--tRNA ligase alpha subunit [Planctomycetes bacterium ADurb.Bin126]|nr:MAG: Phenylalanine--tRNA ligase alpha subunit [Planctomycetes bacterium ADurb.Bin126]HOD84475.1 phenylalanine--tRNA ligase subunit alpha [Phycisphaerae bacterium]HQL75728.1 phenylalanine--tRNA ligase subunit alpha [Phycisphaerae bacterium]
MSFFDDIQNLIAQARQELQAARDPQALETWRIRYLGLKGAVKSAMQKLKDVPKADKPAAGKAANELKQILQQAFDSALAAFASVARPRVLAGVDVTLPGSRPRIGHAHVLSQTIDQICEIFGRMGFTVAYGPEVEDERHNFEALNIPAHHPARDVLDNFYIDERTMLRSQTSTVQIRVMESQQPPVRIIAPGRVYRPDTVDATHSFMFHQVEGLYVDEGVSMADLKTALDQFCKAYFGPDVRTRFRPSFFPFTEPSAEVDIEFHYDDGRKAWIELGGCGMVDPNVLEAVGYDSERYTGYAFGLGIERMVMRKHAIPDIRLLFESDVRFLHQF